jgi:HEAT repeat protein
MARPFQRKNATLSRLLLLAPIAVLAPVAGGLARQDDVASLLAELEKTRDEADPAQVAALAAVASREALDALLRFYDEVSSTYMRREIVRVLPAFDGVGDAETTALQRLTDVATASGERELRAAAIEALGRCAHLGKTFLVHIVESTAQDEVREAAMDEHLRHAEDSDFDWYKKIFQTSAEPQDESGKDKKEKKEHKKKDENEPPPERKQYNLDSLREKAFVQILSRLGEEDVIAAKSDPHPPIRRIALEELERRGWKGIEEAARGTYEYIEEMPENRALAAEILVKLNGAKEAASFIETGQKFATPDYLRERLAALVSGMHDAEVDKKVARLIGRGKPYEKVFALRAAQDNEVKGVEKDIRAALSDKDPIVVSCAVDVIAARKDTGAVEDLVKLADRAKDEGELTRVIDVISALLGADPAWEERLSGWLASPQTAVRNAALQQLGVRKGKDAMPILLAHLEHADWSTRLAALKGLVALREPAGVGAIIEHMGKEQGRMLDEFADALWTLTGEPYRTRQANWKAWWEKAHADFQIISAEQLAQRAAEEETRRLKQISAQAVDFFGIRIVSHRVIFILDVSGSMAFDLRAEFEGQRPEPRMDVAKRELKKCIDGLEEGALFNILTFSGDVASWLDGGIAGSSGKTRDEAKTYVDRLGAFGATNMYDALELAFDDPEVDTIYLLSDGEPSAGLITDSFLIREDIRRKNEHRGIVIHTIAVGGKLQILEWLAEDSGGSHVEFQ